MIQQICRPKRCVYIYTKVSWLTMQMLAAEWNSWARASKPLKKKKEINSQHFHLMLVGDLIKASDWLAFWFIKILGRVCFESNFNFSFFLCVFILRFREKQNRRYASGVRFWSVGHWRSKKAGRMSRRIKAYVDKQNKEETVRLHKFPFFSFTMEFGSKPLFPSSACSFTFSFTSGWLTKDENEQGLKKKKNIPPPSTNPHVSLPFLFNNKKKMKSEKFHHKREGSVSFFGFFFDFYFIFFWGSSVH